MLNKLIYVHEGKVRESSKRNYLKNKYIFASNQKKSDDLWIDRATYTLDSFHLNKAILIASGRKNNKDDYEYLKKLVYSKAKDTFSRSALQMIEKETNENKKIRNFRIL